MNDHITTGSAIRVLLARSWKFVRTLLGWTIFAAIVLGMQRAIEVYWPRGLTNNELVNSIIGTHMVRYSQEFPGGTFIDRYFHFFAQGKSKDGYSGTVSTTSQWTDEESHK